MEGGSEELLLIAGESVAHQLIGRGSSGVAGAKLWCRLFSGHTTAAVSPWAVVLSDQPRAGSHIPM